MSSSIGQELVAAGAKHQMLLTPLKGKRCCRCNISAISVLSQQFDSKFAGLADAQQMEAGGAQPSFGHGAAESPQVDFGGMYTPQGQPNPAHQQWCALLSLTGVRSSS